MLEKLNCARRFEENPDVKKMGGMSDVLAPHDERARKNGYEHKMRRIELVKRLHGVLP